MEPTKPSTRVASDLRVRRSSEPRPSESGSSGGATDDALPEVRGSSVAQIARWRRTDPPSLLRLMRGELDWIVMKCLEKDRARRYTTANDLATDIQRHLCGEPVVAAPPSSTYRLRKFVRRYRGGVSIAGVIALSVAAALVGITTANIEARHDRERAAEAAQRERVRALLGWLQTHNYQGSWNDGDALPDQVTLELICDHIRAAQATPFELETFARAFAKIDFGGRRSVPRADLLLINNASRKRNPAWEGLGMLVSPTLWLDDNRLSFSDTPFIGPASTYSHRVRLLDESVGLGQHQLRGMARVQIVRLLGDQPDMADQHHAVDHEPIAGMYADVEIPAYDFVVVDAYPAGYPPRINLPEVAQEYQDGFLLESCFLRRGRGSRLLANSPLSRYLVLTISFPTPKMTIACNVSLSVNGAEPREAYRITMTVDGILRTSSPWPLGASVYSLDTVAWGPALAA